MALQITLDDEQRHDLEVIRDLQPNALHAVAERLRQMGLEPLRPQKLTEEIEQVLPGEQKASESVVREVLTLFGWVRQGGASVQEVIDGLRAAIYQSEWTPDEIGRWMAVEPAFQELLETDAVRLAASVIDLSYEYANLLLRTRIVTDIRPIFNRDATEIQCTVISHTLRLLYQSTDGRHEISIGMDETDIKQLADQCDRAMLKSETSRKLMSETAGVPTVIARGDDDASND